MKAALISVIVCVLLGTTIGCDKFEKNVNMFCKFGGESSTCLTDNADSFKSSCCASTGGCNSREFPKDKVR
ncbi:unnamed protein product [Heligmosomoides polygyrus]|uniref:DB domain-containing protein n=1 Tax=Heligmosomoides polygyrus TaxID=6339 RepID=A0A183F2G7_HELPZ|nr:unnamed protein product [Heligmosomoides polygyrus]